MAVFKTKDKVWNGVAWVEIYNPTSADLVDVKGTPLDEVLDDLDEAISTHSVDPDVHVSSGDKTKLSNLASDADATYATKTEVAGKTKVWTYDTYGDMVSDLTNFTQGEVGTQAIVKDPTGDTDNIDESFKGVAFYVLQYDEGESELYWDFLYTVGEPAEISLLWSEIEGKPSSSTTDIDDAVSKKHAHTNAAVLADLGDDDDMLTYKGAAVGLVYNKTYFSEPDSPNVGDTWYDEIVDE